MERNKYAGLNLDAGIVSKCINNFVSMHIYLPLLRCFMNLPVHCSRYLAIQEILRLILPAL
jgi:hypothetical protein